MDDVLPPDRDCNRHRYDARPPNTLSLSRSSDIMCIKRKSTKSTAVPELAAVPESVVLGATKRDRDMLDGIIEMTETELRQEPNQYRKSNIKACLEWIKLHGYPETGYNIWAIDSTVKCQTTKDYKQTWAAKGYAPRRNEAYIVVSLSVNSLFVFGSFSVLIKCSLRQFIAKERGSGNRNPVVFADLVGLWIASRHALIILGN